MIIALDLLLNQAGQRRGVKRKKVYVKRGKIWKEAIPTYRQLNEWLVAMTAQEHGEDSDEKKDQLSSG